MNNIQRWKIRVDVKKLPLQNDAIIWSFKGTFHHRNNKKYQIIADITFFPTCTFTTLIATTGPFHFSSVESRTEVKG